MQLQNNSFDGNRDTDDKVFDLNEHSLLLLTDRQITRSPDRELCVVLPVNLNHEFQMEKSCRI
jgi:hypothetical protein